MFFKFCLLTQLFTTTTAFILGGRTTHGVARSALCMQFEDRIGAQAPLGFWDPLNLLKDADEERFERLRTVELKHGRVSMLAVLGHIFITAGYRFPLGPNQVKAGTAN
jgi:hypothetical protein